MTDEASWSDTEKILKRMVKFSTDYDTRDYKKWHFHTSALT
jgi:hypothetical protein